MFCVNCGKEIADDAAFCPFCGSSVGQEVESNGQESVSPKNKKKWILLSLLVAIALIIAFPVRYEVEKSYVKSVTEEYLQMIKDGPSEKTMDEMLVQIIYNLTGDATITSLVNSQVSGQDLKDIYDALMLHYEYKVTKVERIKSGTYKITIHIDNMNNSNVASVAWNMFSSRYGKLGLFDKIKLIKQDLSADKSQEIAYYLSEASDSLYENDLATNQICNDYTINVVKKDGEWKPAFEEGIEAFVFNCSGIPISDEGLSIVTEIVDGYISK